MSEEASTPASVEATPAAAPEAAAPETQVETPAAAPETPAPSQSTAEAAAAGPATKPPTWFQSIWNPEKPGEFTERWQENLPEEFEEFKAMLANFKDLKGMSKSLKDSLHAARQKAGVKPLPENPTPEQVAEYRKGMGIPEAPYEFKKPEQLPEGMTFDEGLAKRWGEFAHAHHLTPAQAQKALDLYGTIQAERLAAYSQKEAETIRSLKAQETESLRNIYGGALDSAVTDAKRVAMKYSLPADVMEPNSDSFAGVTMLRVFSDMAKALSPTVLPTAEAVVNVSPGRQAKDIVMNKQNPLHERWKKGDPEVLRQIVELNTKQVEMDRQMGRAS